MKEDLSAAPKLYWLTFVGGATWDVTFPLTAEDGEPADLSGWAVEAEIQAAGAQNVNWAAAIVGSSVRLTLTAEATRDFTWEVAAFDVLMTSGEGVVVFPVAGNIRRIPPVTVPGA